MPEKITLATAYERIAEAINNLEQDARGDLVANVTVARTEGPGPTVTRTVKNWTTLVDDVIEEPGPPIVTERHNLLVSGYDAGWYVNLKEERTSGSRRWTRASTGRQVLSIGEIGNMKSLPQKSDGTFSWDKAALHIVSIIRGKIAQRQREAFIAANEKVVMEVQEQLSELGWKSWSSFRVSATATPDKPVRAHVSIDLHATTPERAVEVYAGLKALGLI